MYRFVTVRLSLFAFTLITACGGTVIRTDGAGSGGASIAVETGGRNDVSVPGPIGVPCTGDADCASPLVCEFGVCHAVCAGTEDCPDRERCTHGGERDCNPACMLSSVCELPGETTCVLDSDCPAPLTCALDSQCRNACSSDQNCIAGQVCAVGPGCTTSNTCSGGGWCADLTEVDPMTHQLPGPKR